MTDIVEDEGRENVFVTLTGQVPALPAGAVPVPDGSNAAVSELWSRYYGSHGGDKESFDAFVRSIDAAWFSNRDVGDSVDRRPGAATLGTDGEVLTVAGIRFRRGADGAFYRRREHEARYPLPAELR